MGIFRKIIGDLILGTKEAVTGEKDKERKLKDAYKELEKGNPEDYVDLKGYIDDDVIDKGYPIEQEDEDDYE